MTPRPGLPERISAATRKLLEDLGVTVHTGARVAEVTAEGIRLANGSVIPSELVVWAAGVRAPEVLHNLDGLEVNRVNQLVVEQTLQTTRDPHVFAVRQVRAIETVEDRGTGAELVEHRRGELPEIGRPAAVRSLPVLPHRNRRARRI